MPVTNALVRITLPYDEVKSVVALWANDCERVACYEHVGSATEKIHIHLLMYNMRTTWENFKIQAKNNFPSIDLKGNGKMSKKAKYSYDAFETIRYMIKGDKNYEKGRSKVCYIKGYDESFLEECCASWKEEVKETKRTKLQEQLDRFASYVFDDLNMVYGDLDFYSCKSAACKFAYREYSNTFPMPMAMNLVKSIVYSCKFDIGFQIPEDAVRWTI